MIWQLLTSPLDGLIWIAEQIEERAVTELEKTENLQKRLTTLQLKFDLGDISEEDFAAQEQEILEAMEAELDQQEQEES
ncbi:gas vesicle protein GvpG [Pseudanabaena mucicola]|uniref:Gas vesicle protein GvpG n=1 Tax=Pseudanabaena mucicola FACHB-723 TaxID=2692860 RepID=A0ABR7ZZX5_9CYAN|nr:gas vesicle protein GvpG [Pseudanabaena mucicola]MBD2189400.1 gas vesicle protein GvpG [Pseudanabaena mucicola FACHB-723]